MGALEKSTCTAIETEFPQIHEFIPAALANTNPMATSMQHVSSYRPSNAPANVPPNMVRSNVLRISHRMFDAAIHQIGGYVCTGAWEQSDTPEPIIWVLAKLGGKTYAIKVAKNGPYARIHDATDPNAAPTPANEGGTGNALLDKYSLLGAEAAGNLDDRVPAAVRAAAGSPGVGALPEMRSDDGEEHTTLVGEDGNEILAATGYIMESKEEFDAMPVLPKLTEEQLAEQVFFFSSECADGDCRTLGRIQGSHRKGLDEMRRRLPADPHDPLSVRHRHAPNICLYIRDPHSGQCAVCVGCARARI